MRDFAEFEPSFWEEDGLLTAFRSPAFGALGRRIGALVFGAVVVSLSSVAITQELSLRVPKYGSIDPRPLQRVAFVANPTAEGHGRDRDIVEPGYWKSLRLLASVLPTLPAEPADVDDEPLI